MIDINKRKEQRFRFLQRLYELTGGSELKRVFKTDVSDSLNIDQQEVSNICQYLKGESLAEPVNRDISITHFGIMEVEAALSEPDKPTQYFPPVNIINIHNMEGSVIQQGNINSSQSVQFEEHTKIKINEFLDELKSNLPALKLASENESEINTDITTIETQLASVNPKNSIIKECLLSIQRILEGAGGAVVAQQLLPYVPALIAVLSS
ncbi:MAG: hypothetical protein GY820_03180 [Gammaproteobacteria bacterium]|nr:hypothetical protein [Gammaproteobacteria bacterium]